ncbi:hypothetical protein GGX14DRAFT_393507 [Mycena pura]|uniref:DUF6532 domain-containing protein n=1 Tax=Mycena pura TaxID=153505 RepID=A0AAD6VGU1_9AGAR|nr:hypothetical protein GGX14DRAFT_393507 [Mycena pura]
MPTILSTLRSSTTNEPGRPRPIAKKLTRRPKPAQPADKENTLAPSGLEIHSQAGRTRTTGKRAEVDYMQPENRNEEEPAEWDDDASDTQQTGAADDNEGVQALHGRGRRVVRLSDKARTMLDEADSDVENDEEELETVPSRHAIAHMREKQQQTSAAIYHSQAQMHAADVAHGDEVPRGRRTTAEAQRRSKADMAAKRAQRDAGEEVEDDREPFAEPEFSSREVPTRLSKSKTLAQRSTRVPPATVFFANSTQQRQRHNGNSSTATQSASTGDRDREEQLMLDTHRISSSERPQVIRNINGEVVANRVHLDLRIHESSRDTTPNTSFRRSESPVVGDKRQHSPEIDDIHAIQAARTNAAGSRPRVRDFEDELKEPIGMTVDLIRCSITSTDAFPDSAAALLTTKKSWEAVGDELGMRYVLTAAITKLLLNRWAHNRGEFKTKMRPIIQVGFETGSNKKIIAQNRARAENLKEGVNLAYAVRKLISLHRSAYSLTAQDPVKKTGLYKNPAIQQGVNAFWFANRRDEGPSHPEVFNPLPLYALALVLTVMENCIDEWITGTRIDVPFTANDYRTVYESHIKSLEAFQARGEKYQLLENILRKLHKNGRFHSGAQPLASAAPKSALTDAAMDAAIAEYEARDDPSESEDDEE